MSSLRSFYIDSATGDLGFDGRGRLRMVDGLEAQKQRIRLRLSTRLGEWFLDTSFGVPWLNLVEKGVPTSAIRQAILEALRADEEIVRIDGLVIHPLDGAKRSLTIDFAVTVRSGSRVTDAVEVDL